MPKVEGVIDMLDPIAKVVDEQQPETVSLLKALAKSL